MEIEKSLLQHPESVIFCRAAFFIESTQFLDKLFLNFDHFVLKRQEGLVRRSAFGGFSLVQVFELSRHGKLSFFFRAPGFQNRLDSLEILPHACPNPRTGDSDSAQFGQGKPTAFDTGALRQFFLTEIKKFPCQPEDAATLDIVNGMSKMLGRALPDRRCPFMICCYFVRHGMHSQEE